MTVVTKGLELLLVLEVRIEDSLNSDRTVGMYMDKSDIWKVVCGD